MITIKDIGILLSDYLDDNIPDNLADIGACSIYSIYDIEITSICLMGSKPRITGTAVIDVNYSEKISDELSDDFSDNLPNGYPIDFTVTLVYDDGYYIDDVNINIDTDKFYR